MELINKIFYFFTPYLDAREKAVEVFFKSITERSDRSHTRSRLSTLMQRDVAMISLWAEYRYKGYRYLSKAERKRLHTNLRLIVEDFGHFYTQKVQTVDLSTYTDSLSTDTANDPNKAMLIRAIMEYFSPQRGAYEYRDSSSFGRLLANPAQDKLVGDCNQIVTLYLYMYSRYYKIQDLQLRILPEHVALHYNGIDIETTSGELADYSEQEGSLLLPVEEIVSINLLDTTDSYLSTHEIAAEDFLQASRFAFILSHEREVVAQNLQTAYTSLINLLMKRNDYNQALKVATTSQDQSLINIVGHNGAIYEIDRHNYAAARRFSQHASKHDELVHFSWQSEGTYQYQHHHYLNAIKAFEHINDESSIRQCYEALFVEEQEKLSSNLTTESIKQYAGTIKNMRAYARKSGNKSLIEYVDGLHKHL